MTLLCTECKKPALFIYGGMSLCEECFKRNTLWQRVSIQEGTRDEREIV